MSASAVRSRSLEIRVALLVLFVGMSVLLETVFHLPVRMPGHRAFPTAVSILLFADTFGAGLLLPFAVVIPAIMYALGMNTPLMVISWVIPAAVLMIPAVRKRQESVVICIAVGVIAGLSRFLALDFGVHKQSEAIRLAGHASFGVLGGLTAWAALKAVPRKE